MGYSGPAQPPSIRCARFHIQACREEGYIAAELRSVNQPVIEVSSCLVDGSIYQGPVDVLQTSLWWGEVHRS